VMRRMITGGWDYTEEIGGATGALYKAHLRLFSLSAMTRLLEEAGYRVAQVEYKLYPHEWRTLKVLLKALPSFLRELCAWQILIVADAVQLGEKT